MEQTDGEALEKERFLTPMTGKRGVSIMVTHCCQQTRWLPIGLVMLVACAILPSLAYGEAYIAGQFGIALPSIGKGLTDVKLTDFSPEGSMSDRALKPSFLFGAKVGYFFPQARGFGIETEVFATTPHIKGQTSIVSIPPGATLKGIGPVTGGTNTTPVRGDHFRVVTWTPINLVFRYHKTRLQPYFAVGPGVFFARVKSIDSQFPGTQNNTKLGLNTKAGLEYFITRRFSMFGEWKYNYTKFHFEPTDNQVGFKATYNMHLAAFGLSYHF